MRKIILVFMFLMATVLVGCTQEESTETKPSTFDEVVKEKKLVVGTASGYFPFHMTNKDGDLVGYDIDTAKAIADALKVEVEFKQFQFDGLIPALQAGEVDMVIAGMTIRGDRAMSVSFSDPYFETGQVLMVPASDMSTKTWEDLDKSGNTIAVPIGTTGALLAKQLFKNATVSDFDDITAAALAVKQGQAAALMYDEPGVRAYELLNKDSVRGVYEIISADNLGIAVRKGDVAAVQWLNSFLASYKKSPAEIDSFQKWFESNDWMDTIEQAE